MTRSFSPESPTVTRLQPGKPRASPSRTRTPDLLEIRRAEPDHHEVALRGDEVEACLPESLLQPVALPDHEPAARRHLLPRPHRGRGRDLGGQVDRDREPDPLGVVGNPLGSYAVADPEARQPVRLRERAGHDDVLPFEGQGMRIPVRRVVHELLVGLVHDQELPRRAARRRAPLPRAGSRTCPSGCWGCRGSPPASGPVTAERRASGSISCSSVSGTFLAVIPRTRTLIG